MKATICGWKLQKKVDLFCQTAFQSQEWTLHLIVLLSLTAAKLWYTVITFGEQNDQKYKMPALLTLNQLYPKKKSTASNTEETVNVNFRRYNLFILSKQKDKTISQSHLLNACNVLKETTRGGLVSEKSPLFLRIHSCLFSVSHYHSTCQVWLAVSPALWTPPVSSGRHRRWLLKEMKRWRCLMLMTSVILNKNH